jgi:hypothetical protein
MQHTNNKELNLIELFIYYWVMGTDVRTYKVLQYHAPVGDITWNGLYS